MAQTTTAPKPVPSGVIKWTAGLSIAESRASLYEDHLANENAVRAKINPKFRTFRKVVDIESRCWISAVAVVADYAAILSDDFTELRMRLAACAVSSGGGISIIDCETGRLVKVLDDRGASRPKIAVCFSNPPKDLRVGPLMAIGTTAQCEQRTGTRDVVRGRLVLKDLLTGETLFDCLYPVAVNCVAMYEGTKGVRNRNKVFLSTEEQLEADVLLSRLPMLISIVVAGTGSKVHVWAFEVGPDAELAVLDRHEADAVVLGVAICVAETTFRGHLKAVIITCGSDDKIHVYDMKTFDHLQTMDHTCGCFCVAAVCIPDDPPAATEPGTYSCVDDDEDDDDAMPPLVRQSSVSAAYAAVDLERTSGPRVMPRVRAVSGGFDGRVRVWDADKGVLLHSLEGHAGCVNAVAMVPSSSVAAGLTPSAAVNAAVGETVRGVVSAHFAGAVSAGEDGIVRIWDISRGLLLGAISAHANAVTSIAVSATTRPLLVTGGKDGKVCVWDLEAVGSPVKGLFG